MKPLTREIEHNHIFREGMIRQAVVQQRMAGRYISQWPWDGGILTYFVSQARGDHIEIGCAYGGTAILAALANPHNHIHSVDPFEMPDGPNRIDPYLVRHNFRKFDGGSHITLYVHRHPPLPPSLENHRFSTALIDGSHFYEDCLADWENLRDRVDDFILFHDINGVDVKAVFEEAQQHPDWELAYQYKYMGVVRHV